MECFLIFILVSTERATFQATSYGLPASRLKQIKPDALMGRFKLDEISEDNLEVLEAIAKKRGLILRGGEADMSRASQMLINDYRSGKLGKISLETVALRGL